MEFEWLDKAEYPFASNYFKVNGNNLHYIDEGKGDILLFVHGTPSWSFDFRNVIKKLSPRFRCLAIDHIGFGLSDKPEHFDYSTQNHSSTLEKFCSEKNLNQITLVVHDFGGPIGLNFAIHHPEMIKRIIVLNSWLWSSTYDPDYVKLTKILRSPLLPLLYLYLNFSPRFILPGSFGDKKLSKKILFQYTRPFRNKSERYGALAFVRSLLNDQDWFDELWSSRDSISHKPTLLLWGMKDKIIKSHHLEKFISGFPHAQVCKFTGSGHFPQEEEPETVAQRIDSFMSEL